MIAYSIASSILEFERPSFIPGIPSIFNYFYQLPRQICKIEATLESVGPSIV